MSGEITVKKYFSLNYFKRIAHWLLQGNFMLLSVSAIIITLLYIIGTLDFYSSIVSALFSLTGLAIILMQLILDSKKFADYKPNTIGNWIKSFPTFKSVTVSANFCLGISAKAHATVSISDSATIEQKVDFLLRRIDEAQTALNHLDDRIDDLATSLKKESKNLTTQVNSVRKSLTETMAGHIVGSYDITLFGIIITICGTLIQVFCATPS